MNLENNSDIDINLIVHENEEKLKRLKHSTRRTDGEKIIKRTLDELKVKYVQEYVTEHLEGDPKPFRIVDFYLPKEKKFIEFLGNWNTSEEHKKRYKQKMAIYYRNRIKCIYIFPNQLYNISWILKQKLHNKQKKQIVSKNKVQKQDIKKLELKRKNKKIHNILVSKNLMNIILGSFIVILCFIISSFIGIVVLIYFLYRLFLK